MSDRRSSNEDVHAVIDLGICPFCEGVFGATGGADGKPDGLMHTAPVCSKFVAMDPLSFATAARKQRQKGSA